MNKMVARIIYAFRDRLSYDFSSVQCNMPPELSAEIYNWGVDNIPDECLTNDGRQPQDDIHVTVKYGIHIVDPTKIRDHLMNQKNIKIKLGPVSLFDTNPEYDVVKLSVESDQLRDLNKMINNNFEVTNTHPRYIPHITIAYVKKGSGDCLVGRDDFAGREINLDGATFSGKDNRKTLLKFPVT